MLKCLGEQEKFVMMNQFGKKQTYVTRLYLLSLLIKFYRKAVNTYINLESSEIVGLLKLSRNDYNVKYLNLGHCDAGPGVLEKLISSCQLIQKLPLCNLELNSNAVKSLSHQKLQTLDLNAFKGINLHRTNVLSCKTLTEVIFRCNYL